MRGARLGETAGEAPRIGGGIVAFGGAGRKLAFPARDEHRSVRQQCRVWNVRE
jgi:hypothetical protein